MSYPTVTLHVRRVGSTARDRFGNDSPAYVEEEVAGCLIAPGAPSDLGADRPESAVVAATAHFPTGYAASLKGGYVRYRDTWLRVIGDPKPYPDGTVPGPWSMRVLLEAVDG